MPNPHAEIDRRILGEAISSTETLDNVVVLCNNYESGGQAQGLKETVELDEVLITYLNEGRTILRSEAKDYWNVSRATEKRYYKKISQVT